MWYKHSTAHIKETKYKHSTRTQGHFIRTIPDFPGLMIVLYILIINTTYMFPLNLRVKVE